MTIIIGGGTSAATYAATCERDLRLWMARGGKDVWRAVDPDHSMGQPASLLRGNLVPTPPGGAARGRTTATGNPNPDEAPAPGALQGFMTAKEFADGIEAMLEQTGHLTIAEDWITQIGLDSGRPWVRLRSNGRRVGADRVILATGPGAQNPLMLTDADGTPGDAVAPREDGRVIGGTKFMSGPSPCEPTERPTAGKKWHVFVYGGSATAAWVCETALLRGYSIGAWGTRLRRDRGTGAVAAEGNDPAARFAAAFPAGERNYAVQQTLQGKRVVGDMAAVTFFESEQLFQVTVRKQDGGLDHTFVHQIVYALGSSNTGVFHKLFQGDLRDRLVPIYDVDGSIGDPRPLVGFGTPDRKVMVVGGGVNNAPGALGARIDRARAFGAIAGSLPKALAPAEGIGVIMASIEALNHFMPATVGADGVAHWDINLATANRTQIAAWVASTTDMTPAAANLAVSLIGALRSKTTFGLSQQSVVSIMAYCDDFERRNSQWLRQFRPGFVDILASFMATPEYAAFFGLADGAERAEMS